MRLRLKTQSKTIAFENRYAEQELLPILPIFDQNAAMPAIDILRGRLIEKLLTIQDEGLLRALDQLLRSKINPEEKVKITEAQYRMLQLSEDDIKYGRIISQDQMDQEGLDWLDEEESEEIEYY